MVDLTNVAVNRGVALSDAGLYATVKGRAAYIGQPASFDLTVKSDAGWETSRAFAVNLTAEGQGLGAVKFTGDVQAPDGAAPSVAGAFDVSATDLHAIAKLTGAVLSSNHPDAFRTLSATGSVSPPDANRLNVSLKKLAFDAITASGDVAVSYGEPLAINANLTTGPLNLNPYIVTDETAPEGPGWSKEPLNLAGLSAINGDFKLRAQSVTTQNVQLGLSDIRARLNGGKLTLNINELGIYGGGVKGHIVVNGAQNNALSANITASSIRLLPMLKSLAGVDMVKGLGALTINVSGGGANMHQIMSSLDGSGSMKLRDGAIVGYNLAAMVRNVQSAFVGGGGS